MPGSCVPQASSIKVRTQESSYCLGLSRVLQQYYILWAPAFHKSMWDCQWWHTCTYTYPHSYQEKPYMIQAGNLTTWLFRWTEGKTLYVLPCLELTKSKDFRNHARYSQQHPKYRKRNFYQNTTNWPTAISLVAAHNGTPFWTQDNPEDKTFALCYLITLTSQSFSYVFFEKVSACSEMFTVALVT